MKRQDTINLEELSTMNAYLRPYKLVLKPYTLSFRNWKLGRDMNLSTPVINYVKCKAGSQDEAEERGRDIAGHGSLTQFIDARLDD